MPARSKRQYRMMQAIAHGAKIKGVNISQKKAHEFTKGVNYGHLRAETPFTDMEVNCGYKVLA